MSAHRRRSGRTSYGAHARHRLKQPKAGKQFDLSDYNDEEVARLSLSGFGLKGQAKIIEARERLKRKQRA